MKMVRALRDGGEQVVEVREDDRERMQAIIADPSGNVVRIVEEVLDKCLPAEKALVNQQV